MRKRIVFYAVLFVFVTLIGGAFFLATLSDPVAVSAQAPKQGEDAAPVNMNVQMLESNGDRVAQLRLENVSTRRVSACVVKASFFNRSGQRLARMYKLIIPGVGDPRVRNSFAPGEVWYDNMVLQVESREQPEISLDYVRFKEGSPGERPDWGLDTGHLSNQIMGIRTAYRIERARLHRLLESQGVEAANRGPEH